MILLWCFRIGMGLAGLVVGSFCLSTIKTSFLHKKKNRFPSLISAVLWLGIMAGGWICVRRLLPAYEIPYLIGYGIALVTCLF